MNSETKELLKAVAWRNLPMAFLIPGGFLAGATAVGQERMAAVALHLGFPFGAYVFLAGLLVFVGATFRWELGFTGLVLFALGCAVFGAILLPGMMTAGVFTLSIVLLMVGIVLAIFSPEP